MLPRRSRNPAPPGLVGRALVESRLTDLVRRVQPGDLVFCPLPDLDASSARALLDAGVAAVISTLPFVTGRQPNLGPTVLDEAGIPLVEADPDEVRLIDTGDVVRLHEGVVHIGDRDVVHGRVVTREQLVEAREDARAGLTRQLASFTHNAAVFLQREQDVLLHGADLPDLEVRLEGRPVLVVGPGPRRRDELRSLRGWIREQKPVLIGVDAGARTLLEARLRPDAALLSTSWLGDVDEAVSDAVVKHARHVVVHRARGGATTALERLGRKGVTLRTVVSDAETSDLALLAAERGRPRLIVLAGADRTLHEFLDRDRHEQASNFLTRVRLGSLVVDADAVPSLYNGRTRTWHLVLILLAALLALWLATATTPIGNVWWHDAGDWITARLSDLKELFGP